MNQPGKHWLIFLLTPLVLITGSIIASAGTTTGEPTSLQVRRVNLLPVNHYRPFSPHTVTDSLAVQRLYTDIVALPHFVISNPPAMISCPVDLGLEYHLDFFQGLVLTRSITVPTGGCHFIQLGTHDIRRFDGAFLHLLAATIGVSEAELVPVPLSS